MGLEHAFDTCRAYHEDSHRNCQQEPPEQREGLQPQERKGAQKAENATGVSRMADDAVWTVLNKPAQNNDSSRQVCMHALRTYTCTKCVNHMYNSFRNGPHLWSFTMPTSKVKCLFRVAIAHKRRKPPAKAMTAYATCTNNFSMVHSGARGHI